MKVISLRCSVEAPVSRAATMVVLSLSRQRKTQRCTMRNEFTAIIEQDGEWFIAYCPEIPGTNGQGKTKA